MTGECDVGWDTCWTGALGDPSLDAEREMTRPRSLLLSDTLKEGDEPPALFEGAGASGRADARAICLEDGGFEERFRPV